ncbi:LamG-like jellyroll fold domain-containing protein [Aquisphaera insulae]|uniref:LamG-like jellyroll fold domain-containing protein n=1 Tax=Aquisphaera insulae TaxID=2712864 RepID=UPI0013EA16C9|nr:LamG-like jellyroll fold domain-containing protein [Aquisphaera insulae]
MLVLSTGWGQIAAASDGPPPAAAAAFRDAEAAWHLRAAAEPGRPNPLVAHGPVRFGVALEGDDRAASLARGGDGFAARLEDGGYLEIAGPTLDPPGAEFTLLVRLRDEAGAWSSPLFGSYGGDAAVSLYLRGVDGSTLPARDMNYAGGIVSTPAGWMYGNPEGPRAIKGSRGVVEFLWGGKGGEFSPARDHMLPKGLLDGQPPALAVDARNRVQRVIFPVEPLGPTAWHDLIVRGTGARLELWIDGVLLDLEFPIGTTRPATAPRFLAAGALPGGKILAGFRGLVDHAALWHRPLSDAEIVGLSGGPALARERERAILGPMPAQLQYFRPRGHDSKAGDCFPLFHDGTFRLFYLILRRNMHSKWDGGHGGLEIHQASTRDLVHWEHHPAPAPVTEPWEAWNGTGNTVFHDGKFWMFYPTPDYEGRKGGIQLAISVDGRDFLKHPTHPYLPGGDCEVFNDPDPAKRTIHLLKAGPTSGNGLPELKDRTLVAWVSPADLDQAGAGVLTVEGAGDQAGQFDSIVLGELSRRRWMAGSNNILRTQRDQHASPEESAKPGEWVQLAIACQGKTVTLVRNGIRYAQYQIDEPLTLKAGGKVLVGLRHLDRRGDPTAHFRGAIADARVYDAALTVDQIAALRRHEPGAVKPVVWLDFRGGGTADRAGTLPPGELEGSAAVRDGALVLDGSRSRLVAGGRKIALAHWVSDDGGRWTELPEPFLVTDESVVPQMCPHWFRWNDWYYFIGGVEGIFRSRAPYGPWTRQLPGRLDNLSVPKTGAFAGGRRILAGFLGDDGWGGNLVLRDLVQNDDGSLGTRFVPEMVPEAGPPLPRPAEDLALTLPAGPGRAEHLFRGIPNDVRVTMTLSPQGATRYGVRIRASDGKADGTELSLTPAAGRVGYSASTHSASSGPQPGGPSLEAVAGLDRPIRLDLVCRHDIVDVEVDGRHTLVNRYWNPAGDALGVWAEGGSLVVRDVVIRPLVEHVPAGALRGPER